MQQTLRTHLTQWLKCKDKSSICFCIAFVMSIALVVLHPLHTLHWMETRQQLLSLLEFEV